MHFFVFNSLKLHDTDDFLKKIILQKRLIISFSKLILLQKIFLKSILFINFKILKI